MLLSAASRLLRFDRPNGAPTTPVPPESLDEELGKLCVPPLTDGDSKPQPVSEGIVVRIQSILSHLDQPTGRRWCHRPRTYAILRTIGGLKFMDTFVACGWTDFLLPVHEGDLPEFVRDEPGYPFRELFLSTQDYYLSPTKDIEKDSLQHFRLYDGESIFKHEFRLGQGGFGYVVVLGACKWTMAILT